MDIDPFIDPGGRPRCFVETFTLNHDGHLDGEGKLDTYLRGIPEP